jgi:hypothetical protein
MDRGGGLETVGEPTGRFIRPGLPPDVAAKQEPFSNTMPRTNYRDFYRRLRRPLHPSPRAADVASPTSVNARGAPCKLVKIHYCPDDGVSGRRPRNDGASCRLPHVRPLVQNSVGLCKFSGPRNFSARPFECVRPKHRPKAHFPLDLHRAFRRVRARPSGPRWRLPPRHDKQGLESLPSAVGARW